MGVGKLEWTGKAARRKPDGLYEIVVRQPGVGAETFAVAQQVGAAAEGILAQHRDEGMSSIEVTKGTRSDAFASLTHKRGVKAAAAIEYGARRHNRTGKPLPPIAPLRKGAGTV